MVLQMKVRQIQVAPSATGGYLNVVTVETKEGHTFTISLERAYNIVASGPTDQDIHYLVSEVYDREHRNLQEERATRLFNKKIEEYLNSDAGVAQTAQQRT